MIKSNIIRTSGLSRASLYYQPKQPHRDWALKTTIEDALLAVVILIGFMLGEPITLMKILGIILIVASGAVLAAVSQ